MLPRAMAVFVLLFIACDAAAEVRSAGAPPAWVRRVSCRIAARDAPPDPSIRVLNDVLVDTLSANAADRSFSAVITGGRSLSAGVQHVFVDAPGERFNVTMKLDDKVHLRLNHMDMDIYAETTIDGQIYLLHCFREVR